MSRLLSPIENWEEDALSIPPFGLDGFLLFFFCVFLVPGEGWGIFFFPWFLFPGVALGFESAFWTRRFFTLGILPLVDLDFWDGEVCLHQRNNLLSHRTSEPMRFLRLIQLSRYTINFLFVPSLIILKAFKPVCELKSSCERAFSHIRSVVRLSGISSITAWKASYFLRSLSDHDAGNYRTGNLPKSTCQSPLSYRLS